MRPQPIIVCCVYASDTAAAGRPGRITGDISLSIISHNDNRMSAIVQPLPHSCYNDIVASIDLSSVGAQCRPLHTGYVTPCQQTTSKRIVLFLLRGKQNEKKNCCIGHRGSPFLQHTLCQCQCQSWIYIALWHIGIWLRIANGVLSVRSIPVGFAHHLARFTSAMLRKGAGRSAHWSIRLGSIRPAWVDSLHVMSHSAPRSGSFRPQNYRLFCPIEWVVLPHLEGCSAPHSGPHFFVK